MSVFLELWRLLDARQRRGFVLAQGLALLMAVFTLAGVASVVPFFAVLGDRQLITRNPLLAWAYRHFEFTSERSFVIALGVAVLTIVVLGNVISVWGASALNRFAHRVGHQFCVALFDEYLHRSLQFHLATNSATLFNHVVWAVTRGTTGMLQSFLLLLTNGATSVLIIAAIVLIHPLIAVTAAVALCGSYGLVYLLARQRLLRNGMLESRHNEERAKIASEAFGAMREIIVLNGQKFFRERFAHSSAALARAALNTNTIAHSPRYILEAIVAAALVAGAVMSIGRDRSSGEWLAELSFLGFAAYRLLPSLQQIFHGVVKIRGDRAAFHRIAADLDAARSTDGRIVRTADAATWQGRPHAAIALHGVQFAYTTSHTPAIRDVQLTIPAGATAAFVGPSGSGKTTLAELILGLLCPTGGAIEVDGIPLSASNRGDWQSTIAYVPQHAFLFDASLAENVALATDFECIDFERLGHALRLAQLEEFVSTLPRGYREIVGEHGVRLSGGQRQRVGIARALYRRASLLVLDEPTSALDGLTESEVMSAIAGLRGQCTIILIAHRMRTVRQCDLIFELDGGRVLSSGTYAQLARQSERFERLLHGGDAAPGRAVREPAGAGAAVHKE
ncbi:MAG: ABC transporter ATP-binding protein [Steroidobacteraceae bacterium]